MQDNSTTRYCSPCRGKNYFRYREYSGRRRSLKTAFEKKVDMWLCLNIFVKHVRSILIYKCLYKSVINS